MYLFFVRAFNDIDHITPIVWKMNQDNYPVSVFCINPEYDIQNDYRLSFLKANRVKVDFLYNDFEPKLRSLHRLMRAVMFCSFRIHQQLTRQHLSHFSPILGVLGKFARRIGKLCYAFLKTFFYNNAWARQIIEETRAQALCFDHISPRQYIVETLLKTAKEKSLPALALPHGVFIYTNNRVKIGSTHQQRYDKFNQFDSILTQNMLRKNVLAKAGVQREKIFVMGSARYCDEWMVQNRRILPREMQAACQNGQRLKVVFMTTRFAYRIDVDRMQKTFELLSKIDGIEVVVKPHTRTGKEKGYYDNLPLKNVADISSVELCEWADVMLVIASSIIIETLVQGKPALYLKYLHGNTTQYEEQGACWTIQNEIELKNALLQLREDKCNIPYQAGNVKNFLSQIIYGGFEKRDVLLDYEQFIVNCTQGNQ